jgi:hypothetical protein
MQFSGQGTRSVQNERRSEPESADGEQSNRGNGHQCCCRPSENLGRLAVDVPAHQLPVARHRHDHHEKGRSDDPVEDRHEYQELDGVDPQEAQCCTSDRSEGNKAVEGRGMSVAQTLTQGRDSECLATLRS